MTEKIKHKESNIDRKRAKKEETKEKRTRHLETVYFTASRGEPAQTTVSAYCWR